MERYQCEHVADVGGWHIAEMTPSPTGEWFHERDPGWERLWVPIDPIDRETLFSEDCGRCIICRADVLLSLERAFRAWENLKGTNHEDSH